MLEYRPPCLSPPSATVTLWAIIWTESAYFLPLEISLCFPKDSQPVHSNAKDDSLWHKISIQLLLTYWVLGFPSINDNIVFSAASLLAESIPKHPHTPYCCAAEGGDRGRAGTGGSQSKSVRASAIKARPPPYTHTHTHTHTPRADAGVRRKGTAEEGRATAMTSSSLYAL